MAIKVYRKSQDGGRSRAKNHPTIHNRSINSTKPKKNMPWQGIAIVLVVTLCVGIRTIQEIIVTIQRSSSSIVAEGSTGFRTTTAVLDNDTTIVPNNDNINSNESPNKKLGDGCQYVFLDVGANICVHGRFLLEPDKYPLAEIAADVFNSQFGLPEHRDNRDFCVFCFEPNPAHHTYIQRTSDAYAAMGWRYHLIPAGVSDEDGTLDFYRMNDVNKNEWGFTAMLPTEQVYGHQKVTVPVIRLSTWITQHIEGRKLPPVVYGDYTHHVIPEPWGDKTQKGLLAPPPPLSPTDPRVLMKLDVEGMEYRIIPDLVETGVYCRILRFVFGEFHFINWKDPVKLQSGKVVQKPHANAWIKYLRQEVLGPGVDHNTSCPYSSFAILDDEAYLMDGQPLPSPLTN